MSMRLGGLLALLTFATLAGPAGAQTTYIWNNSGSSWSSGTAFNPNGTPTSADPVRFLPTATAPGTSVVNPAISTAATALSLTVAPNQNFGGWTFTGSGSLTIGGSGSTGITTYGPQTTTFNGPTIAGAGSSGANSAVFNITNGSTFVLSGNSAVTANPGNVNVNGGTLKLDNTATNLAARLLTTGTVTVTGGGVLTLVGNSAGTTSNVGTLSTSSNAVSGLNTIRVDNNGGLATLNFANSGSGFSTRPGTRGTYRFEASTGTLGALASDSSGSRITFTGTPFLGTNGLLAQASGASTVGYATVKDSNGVNFATYTSARGIISAADANSGQTVTTATTAAGLQALTSSSIGQLNIAASTTLSPSSLTSGTLRITPGGSGGVLSMGASALSTNALMLDGANDFAITGTGTFGGTGASYIYVNNSSTTLGISQIVASGANPTVFAGPGIVNLTGSSSQNSLSGTNRFVIAGGVVRANATQIGFAASGSAGIISLSGGVLEIKGGSNGSGSSADFLRAVGAAAGNVTWGGGTANEIGSGGFSAFGSNASVNLGGSASPGTLTWNSANFVADGYALKFGSIKSDSQLMFLNGINLESTSAYQLREINVTKGTGVAGDRTVLSGTISGSAGTADFIKTGNGTLVLSGQNTYLGNTFVQGGTLLAGNNLASFGESSGSGKVIIGSGALLGSDGDGNRITNAVTVNSGGTLRADTGDGVGTLTITKDITFANSSKLLAAVNGTTASTIVGSNGFGLDSTSSVINIQLTNTAAGGLTLDGTSYTRTLATYGSLTNLNPGTYLSTDSNNPFTVAGTNFGIDSWSVDVNSGSLVVHFTPTPVPEPGALFALGAAGLAALAGLRRLRKRGTTAI